MKALILALLFALSLPVAALEPVPVDLNRATVQQLENLPGIGPKKAEAIVELRRKKPFTRVTQLLLVRGIGRRTLDRLRPYVKVAPAKPPAAHPSR